MYILQKKLRRFVVIIIGPYKFNSTVNRLALKSGIDGHPKSPQVGHSLVNEYSTGFEFGLCVIKRCNKCNTYLDI